jgi:hypothetical protein
MWKKGVSSSFGNEIPLDSRLKFNLYSLAIQTGQPISELKKLSLSELTEFQIVANTINEVKNGSRNI